MVYNIVITLSRAAEETGPMKPGNLIVSVKVLIPAVFPADEELSFYGVPESERFYFLQEV